MMIKLSTGTALAAALSVSLFTSTGAAGQTRTAIFAGGCFWCVEADFDKVDGVLSTVSGYTGGNTTNPTYKSVTYGNSGHYEAVRVTYNSAIVSYETLTEYFLRHVDPTDDGGQFCDRGHSYKTAIFVATPQERDTAETEIEEAAEIIGATIVTPILAAAPFYDAEAYHQDYYLKNPLRYRYYRHGCGRDARIDAVWKNDKPGS